MIKFTIGIEPKTKKNSMQIVTIKGRPRLIQSKAFRNTAEQLAKWVKKGQRVLIEGKWHTDSYDTENGKRYVNECIVDRFEFVEKRDDFYDAPDEGQEFLK